PTQRQPTTTTRSVRAHATSMVHPAGRRAGATSQTDAHRAAGRRLPTWKTAAAETRLATPREEESRR
ncbi:MAG: hypothetical protein LC790_05995, partial [Actinobacteria bacterium]|nr:hypothetical protein [Actinomycetota bacterium]